MSNKSNSTVATTPANGSPQKALNRRTLYSPRVPPRAGAIAHLMDLDEIGRRFSQCRRTNISERCCRAATTGAVQQRLHDTRHRAAPSLARSLRWLLPPVARTLRSLDRE